MTGPDYRQLDPLDPEKPTASEEQRKRDNIRVAAVFLLATLAALLLVGVAVGARSWGPAVAALAVFTGGIIGAVTLAYVYERREKRSR